MGRRVRETYSKSDLMVAVTPILRQAGVYVEDDNGTLCQSAKGYWKLLKLIIYLMAACSASSGCPISLSGVGTFDFKESGRSDRYKRFKFKPSKAILDVYREVPELISDVPPGSRSEFVDKVILSLKALGQWRKKNLKGVTSEFRVIECYGRREK